ncbi:hypothetical protein FACS189426_16800 [Bacteroidia bacterium]|nr:hypothetical protein FACS189426_16800 [Bacteroidia bacterium]
MDKGIAIFDYIWLEDDSIFDKNETPKYPIYVAITKECIEFKAHFYANAIDRHKEVHLHNTILSLPLSANLEVKDGLTRVLIEGYCTKFPSKENIYFYDLIGKRLPENDAALSYSNSAIFKIKDIIETVLNKSSNIEWFIRKLILDFLFDLEHTKVFQNSPYYEYAFIKLRENFFFNALANKAKHYYYREIAEKNKMTDEDKKLFFLKEYFLPAEEQWIKSIMNPRADHDFTIEEKGWFENPEQEINDIYKNDSANSVKLFKELESVTETEEEIKNIKRKIKRTRKEASKWQLGKFDFKSVIPQKQIKQFGIILFIFAVVLSLVITDFSILPCKLVISLIVFFSICFGFTFCICHKFKYKKKFKYSFGPHLFQPRLFGAISAAWIALSFSEDLIKNFYNVLFCKNIPIYILLIVLIFIFVYSEIRKIVPYIKRKKIYTRTFTLLYISFIYSYIIGIITTILVGSNFLFSEISDDKYIIQLCQGKYFCPSFVLLFSFIAMFIGIFINLIFENKRITDFE